MLFSLRKGGDETEYARNTISKILLGDSGAAPGRGLSRGQKPIGGHPENPELDGLGHPNDFDRGIRLAVNITGDSDSIGAITGNLLGCLPGWEEVAYKWADGLELKGLIQDMGRDLFIRFQSGEYWWDRYSEC